MARAPLFPGEPPLALLALAPAGADLPPFPPQGDALSDPPVAELAGSMTALLPAGGAWRSPDNAAFDAADGSLMGGLFDALSQEFAVLYRRLFGITQESTAATVDAGLEDWEEEYGLPDPCFGDGQTRQQRLRALQARVRSAGTITRRDFVDLAASIGYLVTIDEPLSFECGVSDCGGEGGLGGPVDYAWIVRVSGIPVDHFECGVSECGLDALTDFGAATDLECLFRRMAPAWTRPIFDYEN